jgi:hypothetical protein
MAIRIQIKVTVPKEIFNSAKAIQAIAEAQRKQTAPDLKQLFAETVQGWNNPPIWGQHQTITRNKISIAVYPTGDNAQQYEWVNNGTRAHDIFPRNAGGMLRFRTGYTPSTRPRILSSRPFNRFGPYMSWAMVHHPGIRDPRAFDETIAEQYADQFEQDMQDAIDLGAK